MTDVHVMAFESFVDDDVRSRLLLILGWNFRRRPELEPAPKTHCTKVL